ncbi:MAG: DEAD/DEAH box helicase family protein [Cyanobacteria bacterium P01_H01_bin.121]
MPRTPKLTYDRGTLILHPPPRGQRWIHYATWDDRIEKFRIPASEYLPLLAALAADNSPFDNQAAQFESLKLTQHLDRQPYRHQSEALNVWSQQQQRGVVVLPTGSGKSYLAQLAMQVTACSTLIIVPTLDLMHQWYANLEASFPGQNLGLLGGGSRDRTPILIATYDSAAIQAENLGDRYGLLVFDECHHLPSDFSRVIAEYSIAPYRLGITATPERSDDRHHDLNQLIGPEVYRKTAAELSGIALADYEVVQLKVELSAAERDRYTEVIAIRNRFLRNAKISLGGLKGWQRFVQASARSAAGRRAMQAHHEAKSIALGTEGKLTVLAELLQQHYPDPILVFTNDNATVYRIATTFLIPAITHQTPVKERHAILDRFKSGVYPAIVAANVLDEGVDVPDARIAIFLAGSGTSRQFIQRLGRILRRGSQLDKQAILYEVIATDTVEEGTAKRRRQTNGKPALVKQQPQPQQLELVRPASQPDPPDSTPLQSPKAAEASQSYSSSHDRSSNNSNDASTNPP